MLKKLQETIEFIKKQSAIKPYAGIILGSGLGGLVKDIRVKAILPYSDIPNFPVSTVPGHAGRLILGSLGGKEIVAMQGRFHYYEGYSMETVTFPVRVLALLGIELLILSNAAGGLNPSYDIGDIMLINDHINMMGVNPLSGPNIPELGPRFPDMSEPYDHSILAKARSIALKNNIETREGVYVGMSGPTYETPAEYNFLRLAGGDAVGMSTVPEVIVARHMGLPCFALSVITDLGVKGKIMQITHQEVIDAANAAEPRVAIIVKELLTSIQDV
jgi:purine-nucleoside phosphorylase